MNLHRYVARSIDAVRSIDRDCRTVIYASAVRGLDHGFLGVFLGVYLNHLEYSAFQAGLVFSAIMAGGAISNVIASWKGAEVGRRRMLLIMAALMGVGGALYPLTEQTALLIAISLIAMTTSTGGDRTAFLSLDMAILGQTGDPRDRTALFSWYNLAGRLTKAVGALLIAVPAALQAWLGMEETASFKAMFFGYAAVAFIGIVIYGRLGPNVERPDTPPGDARRPQRKMSRRSRSIMLRLAALFGVDSLGGGFMVYSYMSFFFASRFDMNLETIAAIFFVGQLLNSVSIMLAAPTAADRSNGSERGDLQPQGL